jgi:hypothetical protein
MAQIPDWIARLANAAAGHLAPVEPLAPLGCHCHQEGSVWELSLFPSDTEMVGGSRDGQRLGSRFVVDVTRLLLLFSDVYDCTWQPARFDGEDELGCHLAVIGKYFNQVVALRVLSKAPQRFPPGRRAIVHEGRWEERW